MVEHTICIGRVCRSKAGRDKGKYVLVKEIVDEQFVLIVDGAAHKIASPKRKRVKHLECRGDVAEAIAAKLKEGAKVFDAEINSALKSLGYDENR